MRSKDELDNILDRALSSYVEAEPLAGLEDRVLKRIPVHPASRSLAFRLSLAFGMLAAACVAVLLIFPTQPVPSHKTVYNSLPSAGPVKAMEPEQVKKEPRKHKTRTLLLVRHKPAPVHLPKLPVFPIPSPMTGEERALVAFARNDPDSAVRVFSDLQKQANEPIDIQPIEIRPLDNSGAQ